MSDFRRKKLLHVFNVFFDVNHSGTIEKKDFELAIERIRKTRGWKESDPKYSETKDILLKVWDGLQQKADANKDGQVSHEEWVSMWNDYAKNPEKALEWQNRYMNFMFDLEDSSGDGSIDEEEFKSLCVSYGLNPQDSAEAYNKFTSNKTVDITREVFAGLWKQFFASEDPNAPGNYIFGKVPL
ncbi:calexcitin-2 [Zootermopsis nevadensis]|uniref:calexcitin-2 n=1 Tax=Zootermopsis nevadensis TaxID=136037 RepID=UPI000B8EE171|nr:calexcitin-2 [Zootermopsis nevadensis]XP_021936110.1 calexcitin-2 [Zootermopsis nevadensis]XP_021936111.1 calexcitin-2 [Zootermopsis nevadensis]